MSPATHGAKSPLGLAGVLFFFFFPQKVTLSPTLFLLAVISWGLKRAITLIVIPVSGRGGGAGFGRRGAQPCRDLAPRAKENAGLHPILFILIFLPT